jgi:hypothetical protein
MSKYIFKTSATMKEHSCRKWWIDPKYIRDITIEAENLDKAIEDYRKVVENNYGTSISNNAIKMKEAMYIDTKNGPKQIGYIFTGKTDFDDNHGNWIAKYIDLWVTILTVVDTDFGGAL